MQSKLKGFLLFFILSFGLHLIWENSQAFLYKGFENFWWINNRKTYTKSATWVLPVLIGILLAVSFELWAVYVDFRWAYNAMPLIPIVKVGLTPVLQMIVIPLLVIRGSQAFAKRCSTN